MGIFHAAPTRKGRANWLRNMVIKEISLVDDPANPGCNIIYSKARKMPSAASIAAIVKDAGSGSSWPAEDQTLSNPGVPFVNRVKPRKIKPMSKRRWETAVTEILKENCARDPALVRALEKRRDRKIAKKLLKQLGAGFDSSAVETAISKAQEAGETIERFAKRYAEEFGVSYYKAFAAVTASGEGARLYSISKGRTYAPDQPGANNYAAGIDADEQAENTSNDGSDMDVDGATPDESMQAINDEADRIQADTKQSRVNALLQAGQRLPGHYSNSRRATRL
jgi:hypothetical protein